MKVLVVGAQGQLARSLVAAAAYEKDVDLVALGRPELDLLDRASLLRAVDDIRPTLVVNTAAYTAVDRAEAEPGLAHAINCEGAKLLAQITAQYELPLIHISTDYVFDGAKEGTYSEMDLPNPQNTYGRSKLAGEMSVMTANLRHIILRTSWLYSPHGHNFVKTILHLARERSEIRVVADQYGNPTYAPDLASAILSIARRLSTGSDGSPWGIYHAAGARAATWHELAEFAVRTAAEYGWRSVPVRAISTSEYPTPARRPPNSRLDCEKLATRFGVRLPAWPGSLKQCVAQLCALR